MYSFNEFPAFLTNYPEKEEEEKKKKSASTRNRTGDFSITSPAIYHFTDT